MDNIDESNVIVNQNFEKSEVMICETTATEIETIKQIEELNPNEQMEVTENKISTNETEIVQETNIAPTPEEIELTNKLRNISTSAINPNSSSLNILNEYGSSSDDDSDDSSSSSESSDSSSSSESDSDEEKVVLNVKSTAKLE